MIGILNYGMGNIASVVNVLNYLNISNTVINNYREINRVDKLILPGVGAFGMAMENLNKLNFTEELNEQVLIKHKPIIGICLGMQLLLNDSEEFGFHQGLGYISGRVKSLKKVINIPVPHMGWNDVEVKKHSTLVEDTNKSCFYFVHSFYCDVSEKINVTGTCHYGFEIDVMIEHNNIMGCQFHPEKSQKAGMLVFNSFNKI